MNGRVLNNVHFSEVFQILEEVFFVQKWIMPKHDKHPAHQELFLVKTPQNQFYYMRNNSLIKKMCITSGGNICVTLKFGMSLKTQRPVTPYNELVLGSSEIHCGWYLSVPGVHETGLCLISLVDLCNDIINKLLNLFVSALAKNQTSQRRLKFHDVCHYEPIW